MAVKTTRGASFTRPNMAAELSRMGGGLCEACADALRVPIQAISDAASSSGTQESRILEKSARAAGD